MTHPYFQIDTPPVYLFNRDQLLNGLDTYVADMSPAMRVHTRQAVMRFLDSPAAADAGMHFWRAGSAQDAK